MLFTRNEYLNFLATGDRQIVREPAGRFPSDVWVIKTAKGEDIEADLGGFAYSPVHIPDTLMSDLDRSHAVARDGSGYRLATTLAAAA